ncbi:MAG: ribonuclease H-like domain-containing protein [Candidatus Aenigmarchaeota archaeon]|nr:ribonuclease H-like domain-containing protein [Candidatus Aenigmarchaeota archaeon]MCX8190610.1 ribonuclease H-like domain-containing protein [Candidatus Aenigmarchaeota archaeon]MDW8160153.1 ribonuclease H-like domain-containing protein [Candidatus Aenigmarchaeota archaeon]
MVVYLDIETTSLHADIGTLILAGFLNENSETFFFSDSPKKEKETLEGVVEFLKKIKNEKIYIWNVNFDIPFLITRCLKHRVDVSVFPKLKLVDLLKFSREKLRLSTNTLENVSLFLDLDKNLKLRGKDILILYQEYLEGKKENKEKIIEHCRDDLIRLKEIHEIAKVLIDEWEKQQNNLR